MSKLVSCNTVFKFTNCITGPGGVRDYKAHVVTDYHMVGIGTMSREGTSDLRYIWRGAPGSPHPVSRGKWAGEVGWHIPPFVDWRNITSGQQIKVITSFAA